MPGFEVGSIDVGVEPDFTGFGRKTRDQLVEEEARLRNLKVQVEPELSKGFRRELIAAVREASAGVTMQIEVETNIPTGFRKKLIAAVREASAGVNMAIEAKPVLAAGFRRELTEMVTRSAAGVTMKIEAKPVLSAAFRRELREAVKIATAGEGVKVEVNSQLSEGFRKNLQAQLTRSTRGLQVKVDAAPQLVKGFRKQLDALLKKGKANTFTVFAEPRLAPGFRRKLRELATRNATTFPVTVDIVAEAPRDIRAKLLEAIRKATAEPPLVARVKIEPDMTDLRKRTQAAIASVNRGLPQLRPGVDTNTLRHRLISDVNQTMAAANRLAKLNVVATIRTVGQKGLTAAHRGLQLLGRAARATAIGLGAVGAAIGAVGATGLKAAGDFEFMRTNFGILLDDAGKGEQVFQGLLGAAKKSIYEIPDLQPLVQNLLVVSKLAPKALNFREVIPTFQAVTDLGATLDLTGPALTRVGLALSKIAGRGKLTGEELRSISKNAPGLNAIQLIADRLGVSVPDAFQKIREGAVDSNEAIDILLDGIRNFKGAAGAGLEEVTTTFKGALSNLPDILRINFFEAFQDELPKLTAVIGPNGPLVAAFTKAAPALAKAFVPVADALFTTVADFAPAISSLVSSVTPVFSQLARASEAVGKGLRGAFANMGPGLHDAAESFAGLLAALSPILPILGKLVGLIGSQLSRVLDGLLSSGAAAAVVKFFAGLEGVLERLLPILAQVAETVAGALLDAFASIDLDQLGDSFGILATAVGDLLVALAPVIPELVDVAAIFAKSLAPAIEASIPLITGFLDAAAPVARVLAGMAPSILILVGIGKAALALGKGVAILTQFRLALENVRRTQQAALGSGTQGTLFGGGAGTGTGVGGLAGMLNFDAGKINAALKGVATTAAITAAGMSSYFAAASDDVTTQIGGVATAVGGIATAFATGNYIGGALAAIAAGAGAIFGQMEKAKRATKEEEAAVESLSNQFADSFKLTGTASPGARIIAMVHGFEKLLESTNDTKEALAAKDFFGRFNADAIIAAQRIERSDKAFRDYGESLRANRLASIFQGDQSALRDFNAEVGDSSRYLRDFAMMHVGSVKGLKELSTEFEKGGISLSELNTRLRDLGFNGQQADAAVAGLREHIIKNVDKSPALDLFNQLPPAIRKTIEEQEKLLEVEDALKTETERVTGAYQGFLGAANDAADALRTYQDLQNGGGSGPATADSVLLANLDAARELLSIQGDLATHQISQAEAAAKSSELIRRVSDENTAAVGRLLIESNGKFDVFKTKTDKLRKETVDELTRSFVNMGIPVDVAKQKALDLTNQLIKIPSKHDFTVTSNLPQFKKAAQEYAIALGLILGEISKYDASADRAATRAETFRRRHAQDRADARDRRGGANALGKLVRRPEISLVGEDGPELILPLTKPDRMAALIQEAQRAGLLGASTGLTLPTAAAPISPAAAGAAGLGLGVKNAVDPAAGKEFTKAAGQAVADLGDQMKTATDPGLDKWQGAVGNHLNSVVTKLDAFGGKAKNSMSQTVAGLASIATTGSAGVVAALKGGLDTGTTTVRGIVRGYARALAGSLNPVLGAIGQPKIDLSQFRKGGVKDPRIVPDGSYDVHVFGERGTHGEAYIPFDPNLKSRSRAIADETVRRLGGQAQWFRGGGVTGDTQGLNPEFMRRLERWSMNVGSTYNVGSGYRSLEEQRRLYQRYLAGVPGQAKAAPPGTSMHNFGLASDGNRWRANGPGNFGLRFPMDFEPWHVEPVEAREWAHGGMPDMVLIDPLAKPPSAGAYGALSLVAKKSMEFGYAQALAWAGKQMIASPGGTLAFSGGGSVAVQGAVREAMRLTGVPDSWFGPLMTLIGRESGYDPMAINLWDSNARAGHPTKGLGQMRDDTFLAHAPPGHGNIFNALDNVASVIRYIIDRYGDIFNVQQANSNRPPRGYENGDIVTKKHLAWVAEKNRPEVIIPLTKPSRARALAEQSGLTEMLGYDDKRGTYGGPKVVVEGGVTVQVTPPAAASPEAYGSSVAHRTVPALSAALEKIAGS